MPPAKNKPVAVTLEEQILVTAERRFRRFLSEALPHIHKSDLDLIAFKYARNLAKDVMDKVRSHRRRRG